MENTIRTSGILKGQYSCAMWIEDMIRHLQRLMQRAELGKKKDAEDKKNEISKNRSGMKEKKECPDNGS